MDRNYYRMCGDKELVELGRASSDELAVAMAERMAPLLESEEATDRRLDGLTDYYENQLDELRAELEALEARVYELENPDDVSN